MHKRSIVLDIRAGAKFAHYKQRYVLCCSTCTGHANQVQLHAFGYVEPGFAMGEGKRNVGIAHALPEGSSRAEDVVVAVSANRRRAWFHQPAFEQHVAADPGVNIKDFNIVLAELVLKS